MESHSTRFYRAATAPKVGPERQSWNSFYLSPRGAPTPTIPFSSSQTTLGPDPKTFVGHDCQEVRDESQEKAWRQTLWPWRFQMMASAFTIASFVSIVAIASAYSGRPISDWPLQISINAVIAALTTIMRGALLVPIADSIGQEKWSWISPRKPHASGQQLRDLEDIDSASRGPWGSLTWLCRHPLALSFINLASILTILATAFAFFTQQLVQIDSRTVVNAAGDAHVPWVQDVRQVDSEGWFAAIYDGFLNSKVDDLPATCPSGNCSWDPIPSLGVCGECRDYTDSWMQKPNWKTCSTQGAATWCNYTGSLGTSSSMQNVPGPGVIINSTGPGFPSIPVTSIRISFDYVMKLSEFPELKDVVWFPLVLEVIQVDISQPSTVSAKFGAANITQCAFWYCLQSFSTSITLGKQKQTFETGPPAVSSLVRDENGADKIMKVNDTEGFNMRGKEFTVDSRSIKLLTANDPTSVGAMLHFTGASGVASLRVDPLARVWQATNGNRTAWAAKYAKRLSNAIRQQNQVPSANDSYRGDVSSQQAYIRVTWPWLVYPTVMLVGGLLVFIATVIRTARSESGVWGNGSLALLFAIPDERVQRGVSGAYSSHEALLDAVGDRRVYLDREKSGWEFKDVNRASVMFHGKM